MKLSPCGLEELLQHTIMLYSVYPIFLESKHRACLILERSKKLRA